MTIEKRKLLEEPVVIEFEDDEDEEDLSWMIQEDKDSVIKTDNKKRKRRK
jgi:hypothetical protein